MQEFLWRFVWDLLEDLFEDFRRAIMPLASGRPRLCRTLPRKDRVIGCLKVTGRLGRRVFEHDASRRRRKQKYPARQRLAGQAPGCFAAALPAIRYSVFPVAAKVPGFRLRSRP